jgi:hypothetical protein
MKGFFNNGGNKMNSVLKNSQNMNRYYNIVIVTIWLSLMFAVVPASASTWAAYSGPKSTQLTSSTVIIDPIGDTFGVGPVQLDITSFSADYTDTELIINVTFAGSISPGDSGNPNAVVGYIDFDTDRNPATGIKSHVDNNSPYTTGLGVDYFVYLWGYNSSTGDTAVNDTSGTTVGRAPVSFTSNSFEVRVPLSLIGGNGKVNTATVLGTLSEPTDAAPNGRYITSSPLTSVPTLTPIGIAALAGLLGVLAVVTIRRRL